MASITMQRPETGLQVVHGIWQELTQLETFVPLLTGILVTEQLGIQGLSAIPVHLITEQTIRQVIESPSKSVVSKSKASVAYNIIHSLPGRIRFQVPRIATDARYTRRLVRLIELALDPVSIRVNETAVSVVVVYKNKEIAESVMRSRLEEIIQQASIGEIPTLKKSSAIARLEPKQIVTNLPVINQSTIPPSFTQTIKPQTNSRWSEFKPPALSTMLNFMANIY